MFWKTCATVAVAALTTSATLGPATAAEAAPPAAESAATCSLDSPVCYQIGTTQSLWCLLHPKWCAHVGGHHDHSDNWDPGLPDQWESPLPDRWVPPGPGDWDLVLPPETDLGSLLAPPPAADLTRGNER